MPYVTANGIRIYYEWHGPENGPVLVLNNGILMNAAASWRNQTAAFAARYRVLQYDCRGQGLSDHPEAPYSMALHANDLDALFVALGVEHAHVLGISYGGEVAQAFALQYPGRVRSLILADTASEVGPELRLIVEGWRAAAACGDSELVFLVTAPWNFSARFIADHQAVMVAARARYREIDLAAVARLGDAFAGVDFTAQLCAIRCPVCVLVGDADLIKGPRYAEIIHRAIPHSVLRTIPGAGHATCWEDPAAFNRIVLEFLDGLS